ncbi:MAG: DHH family phosphoesterase [Nitrospinota bacterium]|nr:DHH family phosphoesterase [Nitrospinota bacterium]MDH5677827.1 DHH family phosphoesterase [Nitrospinota bacterium]
MKYFVFLDCSTLSQTAMSLASAGEGEQVVVAVGGYRPGSAIAEQGAIPNVVELTDNYIKSLHITPQDRVIIGACNPDLFLPLVCAFPPHGAAPPILFITEKPVSTEAAARPNVSVVNMVESSRARLSGEWKDISTRQKAFGVWSMLKDADRVLILTQNDPDPDAIASGMAVQALLGAGDIAAPICAFGKVTRNENRAMLRLLRAKVHYIQPEDVKEFDKVVMVDVQPPYFLKTAGRIRADVVIDHHPYPQDYKAKIRVVETECGATATIMAEFLSSAGVEINPRLATALLYGVITDTMLLSRESTTRDLEVFSMLWPMANHDLLAGMSRPRLRAHELDYFVKAIRNRREMGRLLFIWLGSASQEDIIPRIADFSLQIGETSVCAVGGVSKGNVVISIRNVDPDLDAGAMTAALFAQYGSAGGHRTMAKAVMPLARFTKVKGAAGLSQARSSILRIFKTLEKLHPGLIKAVEK